MASSQDRPEVQASSHVLFKQKSSGNLASFLRASRESGFLKELKTNPLHQKPDHLSSPPPPSPEVEEMSKGGSQQLGVSGRNQSAPVFPSRGSPPKTGGMKKIPLLPPHMLPKANSENLLTNRESTPPADQGSQPSSASSSHSDISSADGESTTLSVHDTSPNVKRSFNVDVETTQLSNSKTRGHNSSPPTRGPLPPRPPPLGRSPSCSSSEDHDRSGSTTTSTHHSPPCSHLALNVSTVAEMPPNMDTDDCEMDSRIEDPVRPAEPVVGDLKYENEALKHQIMHLKGQRTELEQENSVLRERLDSGGELSRSSGSPAPNSVPISSTLSPSLSSTTSVYSTSAPVRTSIPVPKPPPAKVRVQRNIRPPLPTRESTDSVNSDISVFTDSPPTLPIPVPRRVTAPTLPVSSMPKPTPLPRSSPRITAPVAGSTTSSREDVPEMKMAASPPIKPRRVARPSKTSTSEDDKEAENVQRREDSVPEKPSPLHRPIPVPRRSLSVPEGTPDSPREKQIHNIREPASTSDLPLSEEEEESDGEEDEEEKEEEKVCPVEVPESIPVQGPKTCSVVPAKPPPPRFTKAGVAFKKKTVISDESWIRRQKSPPSDESDASRCAGTPSSAISEPAQPRPQLPYRSVPIIPTPSKPSPLATPSVRNSPRAHTKRASSPDLVISGADSRGRSRTQHDTSSHVGMHRSSSDDSMSGSLKRSKPLPSPSHQRLTDAKVAGPPRKPARNWLKRNLDEPSGRPVSMLVGSSSQDASRGALLSHHRKDETFAVSCTIPRREEAEQIQRQMKKSPKQRLKLQHGASDYTKGVDNPPFKKTRGSFFTRGKSKAKSQILTAQIQTAPTLEEEEETESSSSDDESGGTIRFMPKLRHVSMKKAMSVEEDDEPEYHQLFEYVFVVSLKQESGSKKLNTEMTYTFPPAAGLVFSGKDAALRDIPQFCFPDIDQWKPCTNYRSETFSFVLTDMLGARRFGYCRRLLPAGRGPRLPEVYCIVSPLGCFSLYEKILDIVEERRAVSSSHVFTFLKAIVANPFPKPGRSVSVKSFSVRGDGMDVTELRRPMDSRLEHVDFSLLLTTLSPRKIVQLFSSLLMERRVVLCAHSLSVSTSCAHALLALIYPFEWQHVFIPVLPNSLIDFVCSPLPYIIGIHPVCIKQLDSLEMEEALVVDLDKKKFVRKVGDEASILPSKLFQYLEHSLGSSVISSEYQKPPSRRSSPSRADEIIINTFMTFFVYLFGNYKQYLKKVNPGTGMAELQTKEFVKAFSSKSMRRFLDAFRMTQMFENFREQRENPLKARAVAQGLFEKKIPELRERCQDIEIFSSKSKFKFRMKKGAGKKK